MQRQLNFDGLEMDIVDPYEELSHIFNDKSFQPDKIDVLRGGMTQSVTDRTDFAHRACDRDDLCIKRKFSEFLYDSGIALHNFMKN